MKKSVGLVLLFTSLEVFAQNIYLLNKDREPIYVLGNRIFLYIGQAILLLIIMYAIYWLWLGLRTKKNEVAKSRDCVPSNLESRPEVLELKDALCEFYSKEVKIRAFFLSAQLGLLSAMLGWQAGSIIEYSFYRYTLLPTIVIYVITFFYYKSAHFFNRSIVPNYGRRKVFFDKDFPTLSAKAKELIESLREEKKKKIAMAKVNLGNSFEAFDFLDDDIEMLLMHGDVARYCEYVVSDRGLCSQS